MLTIGEFSNICKVSTKTLRYYAKIGLLLPDKISPENGYRYYSIDQLETMLFIERLKSYNFSLEEIKVILNLGKLQNEKLYAALARKKKEVKEQIDKSNTILERLNEDMLCLQQGRSIMSYLEDFDIELVEVPEMDLISIRKIVREDEFVEAYSSCFGELLKRIQTNNLNVFAPPMVLFHDAEFVKQLPSPGRLDTASVPPICFASSELMDMPRPVPCLPWEIPLRSWLNGSNIFCWNSSLMPQPVSST